MTDINGSAAANAGGDGKDTDVSRREDVRAPCGGADSQSTESEKPLLEVKDIRRSFGLGGSESVEIRHKS